MKKIAIIGGGVAGVCSAYLLQNNFKVTLFEKNNYLGGNNCSVLINDQVVAHMAVIIFPYKTIFRNFDYFIKKFNLKLQTNSLSHIFMRNNEVIYKFGMKSFNFENLNFEYSKELIKDISYLLFKFKDEIYFENQKTILDLILEKRISEKCVKYFLIPFASLYLSMSYHDLLNLPVFIIAQWWHKYTHPIYSFLYKSIEGGNQKLIEAFEKNSNVSFRKNAEVTLVKRTEEKITVVCNGVEEEFDKIVFASSPDQALKILEHPTKNEQNILGHIDTGIVCSSVHTNSNLTYQGNLTLKIDDQGKIPTLLTTWGNKTCFNFQSRMEYYTSIHDPNTNLGLKDNEILKQEFFKVPLPTLKTINAIKNIQDLNNNSLNTFYCGSYFKPSFYHEDAITSAMEAANKIKLLT